MGQKRKPPLGDDAGSRKRLKTEQVSAEVEKLVAAAEEKEVVGQEANAQNGLNSVAGGGAGKFAARVGWTWAVWSRRVGGETVWQCGRTRWIMSGK